MPFDARFQAKQVKRFEESFVWVAQEPLIWRQTSDLLVKSGNLLGVSVRD